MPITFQRGSAMPSTSLRLDAHPVTRAVSVERVVGRRAREAFIRLPWTLHRADPHWVPPLLMERRETLDPSRNPFFRHGDMALFLARRGNEVVGRIAAIRNDLHNETHQDRVGFFGFFECIDDQAVADLLLDAARAALRGFGMQRMRGPVSPSTNDEAGLLVEGFADSPRFLMPYSPPYYRRLLEQGGLVLEKQLLAYQIERAKVLASAQIEHVARIAYARHGLTLRPLNMQRYGEEILLIRQIYNAAWKDNWGFVPMTEAEAQRMAKNLRALVEPSLVLFAEVRGEAVGVALVMHDYNRILAKLNGKLFPFGWTKLLTGRRHIDWLRLVLIGVLPRWRQRGFDAALYLQIAKNSVALGIERCEGSWVLEDNERMNRILPALGGHIYKRYNLYGSGL